MCGRFSQGEPSHRISDYFGAYPDDDLPDGLWNVPPTETIRVVIEREGERRLAAARWGFQPFWADRGRDAPPRSWINARSETAWDSTAFGPALRATRCVVPADAFYEWDRTASPRQPYAIGPAAEGELLGEFGEERRAIVAIRDVPDVMINAILAAEDERFYSHGGVDYLSVMRAAASNLSAGTQQGAGTITMQVARNFFLTREKTITRKLREVLLAWKIEANLSKDEILQLYVNQIFLGQRAYGFASAANVYFGKSLAELSPAEAAMLAGLPQAPSRQNPFVNAKRARERQHLQIKSVRGVARAHRAE